MRIFILILTLIFSAAFVFLNILGFNGYITLNEFFLVNLLAEILACFVLGHFMYRTYANRKKLKKLQQEMTTRQAGAVAQEQSGKKHTSKRSKPQAAAEPTAPAAATEPPQPTAPAPQAAPAHDDLRTAPAKAAAPQQAPVTHTTQQPVPPQATQPMKAVHPPQPDADTTTLYKTPFGK